MYVYVQNAFAYFTYLCVCICLTSCVVLCVLCVCFTTIDRERIDATHFIRTNEK